MVGVEHSPGSIQSERDIATRRERDTLHAILAEMQPFFDLLNQIWRAIDLALINEQVPSRREERISVASAVISCLTPDEQLKKLREFTDAMAVELAPIKRGQFIRVWQSIDWVYNAIATQRNGPEGDDGRFRLHIIRIHLSHLERFLHVLDERASATFAARTKESVDHRSMAEQIKPSVDKLEWGEPLIGPAKPHS